MMVNMLDLILTKVFEETPIEDKNESQIHLIARVLDLVSL